MKNTFGQSVSVTLFGESHGNAIGVVLDGLAPGIEIDESFIKQQLTRRRPNGALSTARQEADPYQFLSGVFEGHTTGTPLCIMIPNEDTRSQDYSGVRKAARPAHADYTAHIKYNGFEDYRGGGHFSGRLTAALVAGGAIALKALERKGIHIGTRIMRCAGIEDASAFENADQILALREKPFPVLCDKTGEEMQGAILAAKADGDSVGGVLHSVITGLPAGVGEPWFDTMEGVLSHAIFSIPAVKGVSFGDGFAISDKRGSEANDPMRYENGKVVTLTNNNGGINGGITNGMPVDIKIAMKPTPTIFKDQQTINFLTGEDAVLQAKGRHDPCIVHRAVVVADSVIALALCDMLAIKYGTDWLSK